MSGNKQGCGFAVMAIVFGVGMLFFMIRSLQPVELDDGVHVLEDPMEDQEYAWTEHEVWVGSEIECYQTTPRTVN